MTQAEKLEALVRKAKLAPQKDFKLMMGVKSANAIKDYCDWLIQCEMTAVFLFNKNVARTLFGDKLIAFTLDQPGTFDVLSDVTMYRLPIFELMLMQAVRSDDPIGYMYKAVFDGI